MNGWVLIGDFVEFFLRQKCQTLKVNDGIGTEQLLPFEATVPLQKHQQIQTAFVGKNGKSTWHFRQGTVVISKVVQKALIEVNDEGTVAAAATNIRIAYQASQAPRQNLRFVADHPFCAFLIRDDSVLFSAIFRK
ncbi:hypothetical protein niasHT_025609 [Heterodera trifolii]|uniref:Serpin domain-containing protein n=1 Tax=Heterodera trifolii TaxID=157864 RepID=A0ABD2KHM9_9BILA